MFKIFPTKLGIPYRLLHKNPVPVYKQPVHQMNSKNSAENNLMVVCLMRMLIFSILLAVNISEKKCPTRSLKPMKSVLFFETRDF